MLKIILLSVKNRNLEVEKETQSLSPPTMLKNRKLEVEKEIDMQTKSNANYRLKLQQTKILIQDN